MQTWSLPWALREWHRGKGLGGSCRLEPAPPPSVPSLCPSPFPQGTASDLLPPNSALPCPRALLLSVGHPHRDMLLTHRATQLQNRTLSPCCPALQEATPPFPSPRTLLNPFLRLPPSPALTQDLPSPPAWPLPTAHSQLWPGPLPPPPGSAWSEPPEEPHAIHSALCCGFPFTNLQDQTVAALGAGAPCLGLQLSGLG